MIGAIDELGLARRPELREQLAHHAVQAEAWEQAVGFLHEAGRQAASRHATDEAARYFEQALAALANLPGGAPALGQAFDLRVERAQALYSEGQLDRALADLRDAHALAEKLDDSPRRAKALMGLLHGHASQGQYALAIEAGERARRIAVSLGSDVVQIWADIGLCRVAFAAGHYRRGIEYGTAAVDALGEKLEQRPGGEHWVLNPWSGARTYLALCLARTGDFDTGLRHAEEAVRIAGQSDVPLDRIWADYGLARVHHARTEFARTISLLERALSLFAGDAWPAFLTRVLAGLASAYGQSGRAADALPLLDRALAVGRSLHLEMNLSLTIVQLGETCLEVGRREDAARHVAEALDLARARGERGNEAWALHLQGAIAAQERIPDHGRARDRYREARALADELGMRPLAARCRLSLGGLELADGRAEAAAVELVAARDELRAMGIRAWLAHAEALLETIPAR